MVKNRIHALSRSIPTEQQLIDFPSLMMAESDRGAAIMGGALVELALQVAIQSRLADPDAKTVKAWFEGPNAPFGTFAAKIALGRALGIFGPHMEGRLRLIKDIRNAFAHCSTPLDFEHKDLKVLRTELDHQPEARVERKTRVIFSASCVANVRLLIQNAFERGGAEIKVDFP